MINPTYVQRRREWKMKNIVICADGTWNRPEENLAEDVPTNPG